MSQLRSHYCGEVKQDLLEQVVSVCGWVHRRRDHGGVIFIDLRDHTGLLQLIVDPQQFPIAEQLRSEFVIAATGTVRRRPEGTTNDHLPTGQVEVPLSELTILNKSDALPFRLDAFQPEVSEEVRLKYRYLDLRREKLSHALRFRAKVVQLMRKHLEGWGFVEVETPLLTKSTPEGARDYLVPSRTHPGEFFALPQSPQIFKQLLMAAGFDRYYQLARCLRDEDLRADRQPEFSQMDIEAAFVDETDIQGWMESMLRSLFKVMLDVDLPDPFPVMTYQEAFDRFGTDRPDLRIPLEFVNVDDLMQSVDFKVFSEPAQSDECRVVALKVPGGTGLSRKVIDDYTDFVGRYGAKGLAYIKVNETGLQSPILKFLDDNVVAQLVDRVAAKSGDLIFFGADKAKVVNEALGALRVKVAQDLGLINAGWEILWVVDFPLCEQDDKGAWQSLHHPFTAPQLESPAALLENPGCLSRAYDVVLNGSEIGGGSIRIHDHEMQMAALNLLNINESEAKAQFGHLLDALRFGCPPHGGIAFGLDRLVMMMVGAESIREVIPFPKTQTASCPLTQAPTSVDPEQLKALGLLVRTKEKKG